VILLRRMFLQCVGATSLFAFSSNLYARTTFVPDSVTSLPEAIIQAQKSQRPLVLIVTLPHCPYCEVVLNQYLWPIRNEITLFQISVKSSENLKDFDGTLITQAAWSRKAKIKVAPTLIFFGEDSVEIAPRLIGISSEDYYGAYLDERISKAKLAFVRK
jgi:thioredoxin-related protein